MGERTSRPGPDGGSAGISIAIGSDHRGFDYKTRLQEFLRGAGHTVVDFGACSAEPVDYPAVAVAVAEAVRWGRARRGILLCATGIGMAIAANKVPSILATPVWSVETARRAWASNRAAVIALGAELLPFELCCDAVAAWLAAEFKGGDSGRKVAAVLELERRLGGLPSVPALRQA